MTRLITSAYFIAPSTAPKRRLIKPNPVISTIFVKAEAKRDNTKGTIKPINRKASICPNVTEVPTATANCSPKPANKARYDQYEDILHVHRHQVAADKYRTYHHKYLSGSKAKLQTKQNGKNHCHTDE